MYDEFIILSNDLIVDVNRICACWWENGTNYQIKLDNNTQLSLSKYDGQEFISIFEGRYGVNATPQTEAEKKIPDLMNV